MGLFGNLSTAARLTADVAESYAEQVVKAPPVERTKARLEKLKLADDIRQALEGPLEDLGLELEDFEPFIPDIYPRRKLLLDRAGPNGFVQIPKQFLESPTEADQLQVGLLEKTLAPEIKNLLIFTDAEKIAFGYDKYTWPSWVHKKLFSVIEAYTADLIEEFKGLSRPERAEQLKLFLQLDGETPDEPLPDDPEATGEATSPPAPTETPAPATFPLDGFRLGALAQIVQDAFNPPRFREFLLYRLDRKVDDYAGANDNFPTVVRKVLQAANESDWIKTLLVRLREARPKNERLLAFSQDYGLTAAGMPPARLEVLLKKDKAFINPAVWRKKLGELEGQVCRISIHTNQGTAYGTGFLLGKDLVLTNYHVVEPVIRGEKGETTAAGLFARRTDVLLTFDYKVLDSEVANHGTDYRLLDEDGWLVDSSPYSAADSSGGEPGPEELDYALVRLAESAARDLAGGAGQGDDDAPPRGCVAIPAKAPALTKDSLLFVLQHPAGDPLKLDVDTVTENRGRRVRYSVNTLKGSSGSPCFDVNLQLAAIHHLGDPDYVPLFHPAEYNQGIPIQAILDLLRRRGHLDELGC